MVKNAGNLAKNDYILFRNSPHIVVKTEFMNPGKGSAIMRARMRNLETGTVTDFTFKAAEMVEMLNVDKTEMQYLYHDDQNIFFMNPQNYDQVEVPVKLMEDQLGFLKPDTLCWVLRYQEKALGVIPPIHVNLKVIESEPAVGGNTVNAAKKPVKVETGIEVMVPLFVKEGETIIVDTQDCSYVGRAN